MVLWLAILAAYLAMSLATLAVYARDKQNAAARRRRVRESTLHTLELLGGWPGAFLAHRVLRHKNRKLSYQAVYWLIVLLHAGGIAALAWWRYRA